MKAVAREKTALRSVSPDPYQYVPPRGHEPPPVRADLGMSGEPVADSVNRELQMRDDVAAGAQIVERRGGVHPAKSRQVGPHDQQGTAGNKGTIAFFIGAFGWHDSDLLWRSRLRLSNCSRADTCYAASD